MEAIESLLSKKPLSKAVQEELIKRFDPFCRNLADRASKRSFSKSYGGFDDWLQEARIFLIQAGELFDPSRGVKFITYATARVWGMMRSKMACNCGVIRIPARHLYGPNIRELIAALTPRKILENDDPPVREEEEEIDVRPLLKTLHISERRVIEARFGIGGKTPTHLVPLGKKLGISKERVRQIQMVALEKMRRRIEKTL